MDENNAVTDEGVTVKSGNPLKPFISAFVIFGAIIIGYVFYYQVLGDPQNFIDGNLENDPIEEGFRRWLGLMYKGGILVGTAIGLFLITVTLSIERLITLSKASGSGRPEVFVQKIQLHLENDDIDAALDECDSQKGTVGNVVKEALKTYKKMSRNETLDKDKKIAAIQKSIEEATALELPMLEKHLTIIATIVSIATLVGLIGTVLGMIRAFAALGASGTPDAAALSNGISEALINTASGITTSTVATVAYNYFTSRIEDMTFRIDEVGISIVETFNEKY
mgnify:CR=1 FL=1